MSQQLHLPKSLLNQQHKEWLDQAMQILDNLQYHIDTAQRAGVPGMDEHQKSHDKSKDQILRLRNTYFPGG